MAFAACTPREQTILPGLLDLPVAEGHALDARCDMAPLAPGQLGLACVKVVSDPPGSPEAAREIYSALLLKRGWRLDQTRSQVDEIWLPPAGDRVGCVELVFSPGIPEQGHPTGGAISAMNSAKDCGAP